MKFLVDITPISEGGDESSIVGCFPLSVLGFAVFSSILIFILYFFSDWILRKIAAKFGLFFLTTSTAIWICVGLLVVIPVLTFIVFYKITFDEDTIIASVMIGIVILPIILFILGFGQRRAGRVYYWGTTNIDVVLHTYECSDGTLIEENTEVIYLASKKNKYTKDETVLFLNSEGNLEVKTFSHDKNETAIIDRSQQISVLIPLFNKPIQNKEMELFDSFKEDLSAKGIVLSEGDRSDAFLMQSIHDKKYKEIKNFVFGNFDENSVWYVNKADYSETKKLYRKYKRELNKFCFYYTRSITNGCRVFCGWR